jgi:hypothetical protein
MIKKIIFIKLLIFTNLIFFPQTGLYAYFYGFTSNNYQYTIGSRAAGMGGAFTAIADDSSSLWYNPSGLTNITDTTLNISANTYSYYKSRTNNFLDMPGRISVDNKENDFSIVPTTAIFGNKLGEKSAYAIGVFVPKEYHLTGELNGQSITSTENRIVKSNYNTNKKDYVFLAGFGTAIMQNLKFGISPGFSYEYADYHLTYTHRYYQYPPTNVEYDYYREVGIVGNAYSVFVNAGLQYNITNNNKLGLNFQSPRWALSYKTKRNDFISIVYSTGPNPNDDFLTTTVSKTEFFEQIKPWCMAIGYGYELKKKFALSFDVIPTAKISGNDTAYQKWVVNYRAGIEFYTADSFVIRTGFYTDLTQQPAIQSTDSAWTRRMDYYCGTAGIAYCLDTGTDNKLWTDIGCTVRYGTGEIKTITFAPGSGNTIFHTQKFTSWNTQIFIAETLHY